MGREIRKVPANWDHPKKSDGSYQPMFNEYYPPEELTHIQLYETTTEGTPQTIVFHASEFEKLCEYAAEHATTFGYHKTTKENWIQMLNDNFVVHQEGNVIYL